MGSDYRSRAQMVRVITEAWAELNLYCPACVSDKLERAPDNTPAFDLSCSECGQHFQLKSSRRWGQSKIVDAGYDAMLRAIRSDRVPNLVYMQYDGTWTVQNLLIVPYFFFTESVVEQRKPLGPKARRAGWVGCNILIREIPIDGKLVVVQEGRVRPADEVRRGFDHLRGLSTVKGELRGWALDVLRAVRNLNKSEFTLEDIYQSTSALQALHPNNRNVQPKIRQQLQKLRDLNFLEFTSPSHYRIL